MPELLDQEIQTLQTIFWSERDPDGLAFAPLADALRRKGEVRQALDLLVDGTSRHPEYVTGHAIATQLYLENGMHAEAEFAARRVLELDPEHLVGLSALATILVEQGDSEEATAVKAALLSADPDSSEARRLAGSVGEEAVLEDVSEPSSAAITELMPEMIHVEGDADSLFEDLAIRPVDLGDGQPDEEELAQTMDSLGLPYAEDEGTGEPVYGPPLELMDPAALAPDEPELEVVDLAALAPDEPELEVVDLAALAPDEPELEVMDLAALAPDEPDLEVMDLAALAPDEPDLEVMDLAALAPDEPELEVMDLAALAPDEPDLEVMDLAALAPDEPDLEVMDLAALAPDEPELEGMDLAAL
ncbi:MAG: tetratricopeptide repeat protein, partial [Gemmatimonadota bacterium]|nr:tetratricopeptide repeat protein [Gemmatimonadota bacterium]